MYRPFLLIILSIFLFLSCDHNPQNTAAIDSTDKTTDIENPKKSSEKFLCRMLDEKLNYVYSRADEYLSLITDENIEKYLKKEAQYNYDNLFYSYTHYNAKYWLDRGKKIYHYVDSNEFYKQSDRFKFNEENNSYELIGSKEHFNLTIGRLSHPKYAALSTMMCWGHQVRQSLTLEQVSQNIGHFGFVWMSDIKKKIENKGYGTMYHLSENEAEEIINNNKEYYVNHILFFRDNIVCSISGFYHIPKDSEYNLYDFAREVDDFIQKQTTVDELKPATLNVTFVNFNVDTFKWEPAKDFLQAYTFGQGENYDYLSNKLNEQVLIEMGVMDENGVADYKLERKFEKDIDEIHSGIEVPLRMNVDITDQLCNKGGKIEVSGIFRGKQDAETPASLTLNHLEKIYDSEIAKGVSENNISWYEDGWSDTPDDGSNIVKLELMPGRYIIVIDVETSTHVESRHFYELNVSGEQRSQRVKEILEEQARQKKQEREEQERLAAEKAQRRNSGDWDDDDDDDDGW